MTPEAEALATENIEWAKTQIICRFRRYMAMQYAEDLIAAGLLGLVQAAIRFDASKGLKFRTLAARYVCGRAQDFLRQMDPLSRYQRDRGAQRPHLVPLEAAARVGRAAPGIEALLHEELLALMKRECGERQTALTLAYFEHGGAEAASRFGLKYNTMHYQLSTALAKVRRCAAA